jgi:hypothetical protein
MRMSDSTQHKKFYKRLFFRIFRHIAVGFLSYHTIYQLDCGKGLNIGILNVYSKKARPNEDRVRMRRIKLDGKGRSPPAALDSSRMGKKEKEACPWSSSSLLIFYSYGRDKQVGCCCCRAMDYFEE